MAYSYIVTDAAGAPKMRTDCESCRYPRGTEIAMLAAGYRIIINGRKLKMKEVKERES